MIRIAVVDDHPAVRAGLEAVLQAAPGLVPVGAAEGELDLWPLLKTTDPDVVLLDYHLPGRDGLQICRRIKAAALAPKVLLYSAYASGELAIPAVLAGADGVVGKGIPARELFDAIRAVVDGEHVLPPVPRELMESAARRVDPVDLPILGMLLDHTPTDQIRDVMRMEDHVLAHRIERMLGKLRVEVDPVPAP